MNGCSVSCATSVSSFRAYAVPHRDPASPGRNAGGDSQQSPRPVRRAAVTNHWRRPIGRMDEQAARLARRRGGAQGGEKLTGLSTSWSVSSEYIEFPARRRRGPAARGACRPHSITDTSRTFLATDRYPVTGETMPKKTTRADPSSCVALLDSGYLEFPVTSKTPCTRHLCRRCIKIPATVCRLAQRSSNSSRCSPRSSNCGRSGAGWR
jgi:hypothetical protein